MIVKAFFNVSILQDLYIALGIDIGTKDMYKSSKVNYN